MAQEWVTLRAVAPEIIWARFAAAVGLDNLKETFGEHWPPEAARTLEQMWTWRDPAATYRAFDPKDHPASWLSLAPDQFDIRHVHMSRGVFPEHHGKSLGRLMRDFAERWCVEQGKVSLNIEVSVKNPQHLALVMRDSYWEESGVLWEYQGVPRAYLFKHKIGAST